MCTLHVPTRLWVRKFQSPLKCQVLCNLLNWLYTLTFPSVRDENKDDDSDEENKENEVSLASFFLSVHECRDVCPRICIFLVIAYQVLFNFHHSTERTDLHDCV